jgi:hypothetical protein
MNLTRCLIRRLERIRFDVRHDMSAALLTCLRLLSRLPSEQDGAPNASALHPPRRFRVYADLIFPLPDAEGTPVVRSAVPAREESERP